MRFLEMVKQDCAEKFSESNEDATKYDKYSLRRRKCGVHELFV